MSPRAWDLVGAAPFPGTDDELRLYRQGSEFALRLGATVVMNSRLHQSEDELSTLTLAKLPDRSRAAVLIGGLGMGFTLAAALKRLGPGARVTVAELMPAVLDWNRGPLGPLAGHPLQDPRVTVVLQDAAQAIRGRQDAYDAILLDTDASPEGLARPANAWLYSDEGLAESRRALRPFGVLGIWSAQPSKAFLKRLRKSGLDAVELPARALPGGRGPHHTLWLGTRRG